MKSKGVWIAGLAVLLLLFGAAGLLYRKFSVGYTDYLTHEKVLENATAPDFSVYTMDGDKVKLSDSFGKPIVINFWATWCGYCQLELPSFDRLADEYEDEVVFMMVDMNDEYRDNEEVVKQFMEENHYSFPVYFDTDYEAQLAYEINPIPVTVFIDRNGDVYTTHIGAMDEETIRKYLDQLLKA